MDPNAHTLDRRVKDLLDEGTSVRVFTPKALQIHSPGSVIRAFSENHATLGCEHIVSSAENQGHHGIAGLPRPKQNAAALVAVAAKRRSIGPSNSRPPP